MSTKILNFVVVGFAIVGLLATIDKAWSVYHDYGKTFVVTRTDNYTEGKAVLGAGIYDNRSLVTLREERGYHVIRIINMDDGKDSFYPGDRISFDLLGSPHRL